jgi:hypothetical protein
MSPYIGISDVDACTISPLVGTLFKFLGAITPVTKPAIRMHVTKNNFRVVSALEYMLILNRQDIT